MLRSLTAFKSAAAPGAELTAPIVLKDAARRMVFGPVLVPGEPDSDGETVTAEKIEQVAYEFMLQYGNVDVQHSLNNVGRVVENYVAPQDLQFDTADGPLLVPKGSWMMGARVDDEITWARVLKGELRGFSVMAVSRSKTRKDDAPKRVLLRDLGPDWQVVAVSLVDAPAVPKSKYVAVKSAAEPGWLQQVAGSVARLLGMPAPAATKAGRKFSEKDYGLLRNAFEALEALVKEAQAERATATKSEEGDIDMDEAKLKELVNEAVKAAITPLAERLDKVEKSAKPPETEVDKKPPAGEAGTQSQASEDPAVKQLLEQLDGRLKTAEKALGIGESRQPAGQDGSPDGAATKSAAAPTRDAFGRRLRS